MPHRSDYRATSWQNERLFVADVLGEVQSAAEDLVGDLRRAERHTDGWSVVALSDALVEAALDRCTARLAATGCRGHDNRTLSSMLWRIAEPYLERGDLQVRARTKPRGYAGDYVMLAMIMEDYRSSDPLGRSLDRYFQIQAAPRAVRCRTELICAELAAHFLQSDRETYHLASIGSGPALDVQRALALLDAEQRGRIRVTLWDVDPDALDYAAAKVSPLLPRGQCACRRENIFRLPERPPNEELLPAVDFLICSGLFDYLPDQTAAPMLELFWQRLGEQARMLVGNFAPHNPTRAYMEWIGNWYLIYRNRIQIQQLADDAGIPDGSCHVRSEVMGIDLFLIADKT